MTLQNLTLFLISCLAFIFYFLASYTQYARILEKNAFKKSKLMFFGLVAVFLHCFVLYRWIESPYGQNLNACTLFSLVCWLISVLTLLGAIYNPIENLTLLIFPIAALSIPLMNLFPRPVFFQTGQNLSQLSHILISIAAFGILGMAMLQATLLSMQNYCLRQKKIPIMIRIFPPIETMENHLFYIILWGFLFLSFSLLSSTFFVDELYTSAKWHKIFLSSLAWVLFAILLLGRKFAGWRGKTAVRWTFMGMFLLVVAYFSSKLILLHW